jgi:hypothetical protein
VEKNNVENETYLLLAASAWGFFASPPAYAATMLYASLASRTLHNVCLVWKIEPFRTLLYVPPVVVTVFFAGNALLAAKK